MKTLKFSEFYKNQYKDVGYELYFVKDSKGQALYIGISNGSIWNRWFGTGISHISTDFKGKLHGASHIGQIIVGNLPYSWDWTIELWTKIDCVKNLAIENIAIKINRITIKDLEVKMIRKFNPLYNVLHGEGYHEDPSDRKRLDDEYKKIFG